ncbi:nucleotide sugar dehydrogenase [Candidatus Pelagibacter sp.]|nr:nucleotide sugar dehydrogenase [Candidatus Pelagibacter sp.]
MKSLIRNLTRKKAKIGVIGLGYVGLPRCIQFLKSNFTVYGFDNDDYKLKSLKNKRSYLSNLPSTHIKKHSKKFITTNDLSLIKDVDVIIICLPTPIKKNFSPDLTIIKNVFKKIKGYLKEGQALCFESTTYPGTTEELILPYLKNKFIIGKDFFLIYSPERDDPGSKYDGKKIPKLVSGYTKKCLLIGERIYKSIIKKPIKVPSIKVAEMSKLYENIFRSINISLVNETKIILKKLNIEISDVINAAKTKPFGFMPFYPGPGYGGHCIPVDPYYFIWMAKRYKLNSKFIELSGKINNSIPKWICHQIKLELKKRSKKINSSKVLILGVAYKKNINDDRESPAYKLIEILIKKYNCKVSFFDPFIKKLNYTNLRNINNNSLILDDKTLKTFDYGIIVTDHDSVNYKRIKKNVKLLFDTRNIKNLDGKNIIKI